MQANTINMATVAKAKGNKKKIIEISDFTRIRRVCVVFYIVYLRQNLTMPNKTLGKASYDTLELLNQQMKALAEHNKNNPVIRVLKLLYMRYYKVLSKAIMTNANRDKHLKPEARAKQKALSPKHLRLTTLAMETLKSMLARYNQDEKVIAPTMQKSVPETATVATQPAATAAKSNVVPMPIPGQTMAVKSAPAPQLTVKKRESGVIQMPKVPQQGPNIFRVAFQQAFKRNQREAA